MSSQYENFHAYMRSINIGEPSPFIPPSISKYPEGIPNKEDLHEIPRDFTQVEFESPKYTKLDPDELKKEFVHYEVKKITSQIDHSRPDSSIYMNEIDLNTQFTSVKNFIKFKQSLGTYYDLKSAELQLPEHIKMCACPQCLNAAVPNFQYCVNHLQKDPKFSKQHFIAPTPHKKGPAQNASQKY